MDSIVSEWLEQHRHKRDSGDTETEQDFIDVLLSVLNGVELAGYDVDTVIKGTCTVRSTIHSFPSPFPLWFIIEINIYVILIPSPVR